MAENLKAAAFQAQLTPEEQAKVDQFAKSYKVHQELSNLPPDIANKAFSQKTPAQQADLVKNFGNEDPTVKQKRGWLGTAWHYTGGAVADKIGYAGSHILAGLNNVSDFSTRLLRTGLIAADQGVNLGDAWTIANDKGDKVFSPGRIQDAKAKWGTDAVDVAMRIAAGEKPADIMASATPEQRQYLMLADPNNNNIPGYKSPEEVKAARANFQDTLDAVNASKYSLGRLVANAVLPGEVEGSGFFYKAISGTFDAAYRVLADPLLVAGKAKRAYDVGKYALDVVVGANKVEDVFSKAPVINFWNQYGKQLADYTAASKAGKTEEALIAKRQMAILAPELGPAVIKSLQKADVPVVDALTAKAFFQNTKQVDEMMRGQVGRQRVIIPRLDPLRKARVTVLTTANKVFNIDAVGPKLIDDMFFGGSTTADGIAEKVINGQKEIVAAVKGNESAKKVARFSTDMIGRRIDKAKAKFAIAPLFKDNVMDVTAADAAEQMYRLARLVLPQRESRLISEAFAEVDEVGKKKDMFYGLWSTIADIRGLNTTASGQKIVRTLTGRGNARFSLADDGFQEMGAIPSDFNNFVSAPSLVDIDRAAARSGLINRMYGLSQKDWVDKMTSYWSFLTLAGPRYALRNAGEDLMVNLAIGESPWGIAKARMLSTRLNTVIGVSKTGNAATQFVENPLGVAMRFVNSKDAARYEAEIAGIGAKVRESQAEIKKLKESLKTAPSDAAKTEIQTKIDELAEGIRGGVVNKTREVFARALTEGRLNRLRAKVGLSPLNQKEAEMLSEQIIHGDIENVLSVVSEGGFNFATGNDYVSRATDLARTTGTRLHALEIKLPQTRYAKKQGERGFKAQAVSPQDEASMVGWLLRIGYYSNDRLGSIAVANLDNEKVAIQAMTNWMAETKAGQKFLADARLSNDMDANQIAQLAFKRAKENFVMKDGTTLNLDLLNKIRSFDEEAGVYKVTGKLSLDDLPTDELSVPAAIIGPTLVPAVEEGQYTANLMKNGWTWLGMANARMSREPLVLNEMIKIRTQFAKTGFAKKFIESHLTGIDPTDTKKIAAATLKAKRELASIVEDRAVSQSLAYIDNPLVRTQIAFTSRNFARFYRATEDFYRRLYRAVRYNPESLQRAALTYEGVTHSGWVQQDDQGNSYFVYPGIAPVYNAVQSTLDRMGIGNEFKIPFPIEFGAQVKMLTPSLNPDSIIPTFSGPLAGASMETITTLIGFRYPNAADTIKGYAMGKYAVNQPVLSSLLPSHINRLLGAMNVDDRNSQYASAWRKAVTYLEASGHGLPKKYDEQGNLIPPTAAEQEAYRLAVKNTTLGILRVRFALGFFAPASPSVQLKSDMAQWISDNGASSWKQAFNGLLDKYPGDYDSAMKKWVELYPNEVPYTVTESERKTIAPLRYAAEAGYFVDQNKQLFKDYPSAAAFLIPHKSGFSWDAYQTMKGMGLIQNKRVDDYLREVQTATDLQEYYGRKDQFEAALASVGTSFERTQLRKEFDQWATVFKAARPMVQEELAQGSKKAVARLRTLDELNQMLKANLNIAPNTEAKLREMLDVYNSYQADKANFDQVGGLANLSKIVKDEVTIKLRELAQYNENTLAVYNVLFGRLLNA